MIQRSYSESMPKKHSPPPKTRTSGILVLNCYELEIIQMSINSSMCKYCYIHTVKKKYKIMSYFYMLQHDETHKNKIQKKKPHTKEEILYATRTNKY